MATPSRKILVHYGEIALKGGNRVQFEQRLVSNIRRRLRAFDLLWPLYRNFGRILMDVPDGAEATEISAVIDIVSEVAGVVWIAEARRFPLEPFLSASPDLAPVEEELVARARRSFRPYATFSVQVTRADKRFPMTSEQLERRLGAAVIAQTEWTKVNIRHPDRAFGIGIHSDGVYVYHDKQSGLGGLPVDRKNRVLALLSGGIDSPVASLLMAKRGCRVDFLHFAADSAALGEPDKTNAARLACSLSRFTLRSRLILVPSLYFDAALVDRHQQLNLFRRFMFAAAETAARRTGAKALVAGDSLGQVASQTLDNLVSVTRGVDMPVFRPLIACDKQEIMALSRRWGLYELSIRPEKDCCSLIGSHPAVTSEHDALTALEGELFADYPDLVRRTLDDGVALDFECGRRRNEGTPRPLEAEP